MSLIHFTTSSFTRGLSGQKVAISTGISGVPSPFQKATSQPTEKRSAVDFTRIAEKVCQASLLVEFWYQLDVLGSFTFVEHQRRDKVH